MKITRILIDGFKGGIHDIPLTGRNVLRGSNFSGKTTISEALQFFETGLAEGCKREDLIDYAPRGGFSVKIETDSGLTITRWFKVEKSGKTEMDLVFEPDGLEDNLTQRAERLALEFKDSPLVTFDLTAFIAGNDAHRLEVCMDLMPAGSEDDASDKMHLEIEAVGDKLVNSVESESEKAAIRAVGSQLQSFGGRLPENLLRRCEALATLVKDKWAKEARADVTTKTKAVRALGSLSREDGVSGVNLEAIQERLKKAQGSLDDLQRGAGAAEERRRLIADLSGKIKREMAKKSLVDTEVAEFSGELNGQLAELETAKANLAGWEESELERAGMVELEIKEAEGYLAENQEKHEAATGKAKKATVLHQTAILDIRTLRAAISVKEGALVALDGVDGACTLCGAPVDAKGKEVLLEALGVNLNKDLKEMERFVLAEDAAEKSVAEHDNAVVELRNEIEGSELFISERRNYLVPQPYRGLSPEAIKKTVSTNEVVLEKAKLAQENHQNRIFAWTTERGELANEIPEEMQEDAIRGAEAERDKLQERVEEVKRSRQRFEDQERIRNELDAAEKRLAALKEWAEALGLKGLAGQMMSAQFEPLIAPAAELVSLVLPETELAVSWETPRGKPGMRLFLKRGDSEIAYTAMSGAERAIVGTAVVLAFAGAKNPPALLCLECEVMDDNTEARYLRALDSIAGETSLLIMTHHGNDDVGIYSIRDL